MKSYFRYLFETKLTTLKKILIIGLPIVISLLALFIAFKNYQNSSKTYENKKPGWKHSIDIIDTSQIIQKISFKPSSDEIILEDFQLFFPFPIAQDEPILLNSNYWICTNLQMDIASAFSDLYVCPTEVQYSAAAIAMDILPIVIRFNYIKDGQLDFMYCYYELEFKYFPVGKVKIYSLNFISELKIKAEAEIYELINYKNKIDGFYDLEFATSLELDSFIRRSNFSNLFNYLKSLEQVYGETFSDAELGRINKNILLDSNFSSENMFYYPRNLVDSTAVISHMQLIDSYLKSIPQNYRAKEIFLLINDLKHWINKDAFCFYFNSTDDIKSCVVTSPWCNESNYKEWNALFVNFYLELYKFASIDPLDNFRK